LTTISELRGRPVLIESKVKTKWDGTGFGGTKIALLCGDHAVVYLRDDKPGIPFPGMWDLPGGGREGNEGPIECGIREVIVQLKSPIRTLEISVSEMRDSAGK
jgi:hypothetical protein